MKKLLMIIPLVILLAPTPLFTKEWSAEQKEVLKSFHTFVDTNLQGNVEEIMSYFHPNFIGWDFTETLPCNKDAIHKRFEGIFQDKKIVKFDVEPLEILVEGKVAIIHGNYVEGDFWIIQDIWTSIISITEGP